MKALLVATLLVISPVSAFADDLAVPVVVVTGSQLPSKGTSMAEVRHRLGEPRVRHAAVGGDTPKHPPITRWDYDGFSVFFERDRVVDSVQPEAPAPIAHREDLTPVTETR